MSRRGDSPSANAARRTHCHQGHPYDGTRRDGKRINRYCLTCNRIRQRGHKEPIA